MSARVLGPAALGLAALGLAALGLAACISAELAAPVLRVRAGPAAERPVRRVVALPGSCGALTGAPVPTGDPENPYVWEQRASCPEGTMAAIDNAIRSALELGGFAIIDADKVNAVTATRREIEERRGFLRRITTETEGALFLDATPSEQLDILRELGAEGVLTTRVSLGAAVGAGQRRTVVVQLRLVAAADGALVWARRCELEVGGIFTTDELAMERGARCAIEGARSP